MVTVTIIGILASVAIPTYQSHQAKGKTLEAKIELSELYTKESSFYATHRVYVSCLNFIGYNPIDDITTRYYAIGFGAVATTANGIIQNRGVLSSACTTTTTAPLTPSSWYGATPVAGAAFHGFESLKTGRLVNAGALQATPGGDSTAFDASIINGTGQSFQAVAGGYISSNPTAAGDGLNMWTINQDKDLQQIRRGY